MLAYFQSHATNPRSMGELADDHLRILIGGGVSDLELDVAPVLADWDIVRSQFRSLVGTVEGGRKVIEDGALIWALNLEKGWVRTTERLYRFNTSKYKSLDDIRGNKINYLASGCYVSF